jgi:hypothetical protein
MTSFAAAAIIDKASRSTSDSDFMWWLRQPFEHYNLQCAVLRVVNAMDLECLSLNETCVSPVSSMCAASIVL